MSLESLPSHTFHVHALSHCAEPKAVLSAVTEGICITISALPKVLSGMPVCSKRLFPPLADRSGIFPDTFLEKPDREFIMIEILEADYSPRK
eukprot:1159856-Pelagomonas_calceolata.AAC.1